MFISKITLSGSAGTQDAFWKMFGSEYSVHQAIWRLFADHPDRRRDFLYRLDTIGKRPHVYTVSQRRPANNELWGIETKPYDPQICQGMRLGFTVRVNPTFKREGKRHDVVMDQKRQIRLKEVDENKFTAEIVTQSCEEWLNERSEKNGFKVLQIRVEGYRQQEFHKAKANNTIRYSTVDFMGVLEVIDEKSFKSMLLDGIGPEKGFGCGLMLVRRV